MHKTVSLGYTRVETEDFKKKFFLAAKNGVIHQEGYTPGITTFFLTPPYVTYTFSYKFIFLFMSSKGRKPTFLPIQHNKASINFTYLFYTYFCAESLLGSVFMHRIFYMLKFLFKAAFFTVYLR